MAEQSDFGIAVRRINEIAEDLANGTSKSKGKAIIELRSLCGRHHTVPSMYKLEGVVKEGELAQYISPVAEIWKGRYNAEEVALKVLRVYRGETDVRKMKSRFCKAVVLMKQTNHRNILPFYGASTDVSEFCLVFPWYKNGNIIDYLKGNPNINRYDLLSGAVNGLCFLHENRLVHGALRPSHILIDDGGVARLATAGQSSIVAVPGTSTAGHVSSTLDSIDDFRCSAPEILLPEEYGMDEVCITKESDIYGMAMVTYEVLSEKKPYYRCNDINALFTVQAKEIPERPLDGIDDLVWEFLQKSWSRVPANRPSTVQVYNTLSKLSSHPPRMSSTGELPEKLKFDFQSIKFSPDQPKQHRFYVRLKYGDTYHTTSPTNLVDRSGEHRWREPETCVIETDEKYRGRLVSLEVLLKGGIFKRDKVFGAGEISLSNKVDKEAHVELKAGLDNPGSTVLRICLIGV